MARRTTLTAKEIAFLGYMASGLTGKGTAKAMGISESTVKQYAATVRATLRAASTTEAVAIAIRRGLLPQER